MPSLAEWRMAGGDGVVFKVSDNGVRVQEENRRAGETVLAERLAGLLTCERFARRMGISAKDIRGKNEI